MDERKLKKKLSFMVAIVVLLVFCLTVTSFALASSVVQVRNSRFAMSMGVKLDINEGMPVVDVSDVLYEPGGTYKSEFSVTNDSTFEVWYRIYFTNVEGALKDDITVTVKEKGEGGAVLCRGTMNELTSDKVAISSLKEKETKILCVEFYFSPDADNSAQGQTVSFNITANATQMKNNLGKNFGN